MSYSIVLPLVLSLPILTFVVLVLVRNINHMFTIAIASNVALLGVSLYVFFDVMRHTYFNTQLTFFYMGIDLLPNLVFGFTADGISIFFVASAAILGILSLWYAALTMSTGKMTYYFILGTQFMILASVGFVLSADLFTFYIFWELTIIPVFFMIGIWGGANRFYHAMTLFIYTAAGTVLMLVGMVLLYVIYGTNAIPEILSSVIGRTADDFTGRYIPALALMLITIGFLVKLPILPLHGWLKGTYTELPTPAVILVAGFIGKLGIYGLYRMNSYMFNASEIMPSATLLIMVLAVATIIYGSVVAFAQQEFKSLIAYGSFAHIGVITLGVTAQSAVALEGAIYQVLTHGLAVAGLFIIADQSEKLTGSTSLRSARGLFMNSPRFTFFLVVFAMAFLGLPPMGTFTSELILFIGLLGSVNIYIFLGALTAVFLSAVYAIFLVQNLIFSQKDGSPSWSVPLLGKTKAGSLPNYYNKFDSSEDLSFVEPNTTDIPANVVILLCVMGVSLLALGLYPAALMELIKVNPLTLRSLL